MPIWDGRLRERLTETLVYVIAYPYILFFKFNGILEPDYVMYYPKFDHMLLFKCWMSSRIWELNIKEKDQRR